MHKINNYKSKDGNQYRFSKGHSVLFENGLVSIKLIMGHQQKMHRSNKYIISENNHNRFSNTFNEWLENLLFSIEILLSIFKKCTKSTITKGRIATMIDSVKCTTYDLKVNYFVSNSCLASGTMFKTTITKAGIATMMDSVKRSTYDLKVIYFESNSCSAPFKVHKINKYKS
jgi:hypothetical protein